MKNSIFIDNLDKRTDDFKVDTELDDLLKKLKDHLQPLQKNIEETHNENKCPVSFIVGVPRAGTTVLIQWLASMGDFAYPSNFLTRFAYAPYIGALIEKMLFSVDRTLLEDLQKEKPVFYSSNLGKTDGVFGVNEFQHFFRNYMPNFDPEYLSEEILETVDFKGIKKGLASIESVYGKPLVTKAIMLQFHLAKLFKEIPNSIILNIERDPLFTMQSILLSRRKYYDRDDIWWSVKPKEYEFLKDMDVYHQIAGQVFFTNTAIQSSLKILPETNKVTFQYESFCKDPEPYYRELKRKYELMGYSELTEYKGPEKFNNRNVIKIDRSEFDKLGSAYDEFRKGKI